MGRPRTIYVRDEDEALWQRAEAFARARRWTMSGLIMSAIEQYLDEPTDDEAPDRRR